MKIALIGYGKMGKAIEEIALQKRHEIVLKISIDNVNEFTTEAVQKADIAIEFTGPESAANNIRKCVNAGVACVSGSTGWLKEYDDIVKLVKEKNGAFLYGSNFSIGVNLFFELNKYLANLMKPYDEYDVSLEEIHHTQKKDAPSGTAITLADQVLQENMYKKSWVNSPSKNKEDLVIISKRIDTAPGTHIVKYSSEIDDIEIKHMAHSRKGFASGALLAAEFLQYKKGIFTMHDLLFG